MKIKILLLSALALSMTACAGLSHKFDADRAKGIRKVAIVAVEIQQQKPTDNLGIGALKSLSDGRDSDSPEFQTMAKNVTVRFTSKLQEKTRWQVLPMATMMANPAYKQKVQDAMSAARATMLVGANSEAVYPKGLLDIYAFRKMTTEQKAQLAKALEVDALGELTIYTTIDQSWMSFGHLTGNAAFKFKSRANLQVYRPNSDEPVWRAQNVDGAETVSSKTLPEQMSRRERLANLGEKAATYATDKIMNHYPL